MEIGKSKVEKLYEMLDANFDETPTLAELKEAAFELSKTIILKPMTDEEVEKAVALYQEAIGIRPTPCKGLAAHDDHWFDDYKKNPSSLTAWNRYAKYLKKHCNFAKKTIASMQSDLFRTIEHFADPNHSEECSRIGLVVGDVQSGKTANYLGLINMAVDVGYKKIILLAGLTEDLRMQTQGRCDSGFIGEPSDKKEHTEEYLDSFIGVGEKGKHYAVSFTSPKHDFDANAAKAVFAGDSDFNKPIISVIKKNKSVLENISAYIASSEDMQNIPLLIIDDECDNASINTNNPDINPTAINAKIRELINKYRIVTYVGYSATPYGNIFIDPDSIFKNEGDEELSDLFPKDFITLLEPPSNYFGANTLFKGFREKDGAAQHSQHIIELDPGCIFPDKHKKTDAYPGLDYDLIKAINVFLLSSAAYSLRGFEKKHRTMMINISTYNDIQGSILWHINEYIESIKNEVDLYGANPIEFDKRPALKALKDAWFDDRFFGKEKLYEPFKIDNVANKEIDFEDVIRRLHIELSLVQARIVNGRIKRADKFRYDDYKDCGARLIAVGGFGLSRGLTLEGLMTSYYNRNAQAFDILLQMGRWFGYRPHYDDLVTIFMTRKNIESFCAASEANNHLKYQFRRMEEERKTPKDFGLMVMCAPETIEHTIMVTSLNKRKSAEEVLIGFNLDGSAIDNSKISKDIEVNARNKTAITKFLEKAFSNGSVFKKSETYKKTEDGERQYLSGISHEQIIELLTDITVLSNNIVFNPALIIKMIREQADFQGEWHVVIGNGHEDQKSDLLNGTYNFKVHRSFELHDDSVIAIGGSNNRILNPGILKIDLEEDVVNKVNDSCNDKPIALDWLKVPGRRPILIVFPIDLKNDGNDPKRQTIIDSFNGEPVFGFGLAFPGDGTKIKKYCLANKRKLQELRGLVESNNDNEYEEEVEE